MDHRQAVISFPGAYLRLDIHRDPCLLEVIVDGEIDLANGPALYAALRAWAADPGACRSTVRLDLSLLTFADGCGRRALNTFLIEADREGWSVEIVAPTDPAVVLSLNVGGVLDRSE